MYINIYKWFINQILKKGDFLEKKRSIGRPKIHRKAERVSFYCGDKRAWDIVKGRHQNISEYLTRKVQMLAYASSNASFSIQIIKEEIQELKAHKENEISLLERQYDALIEREALRLALCIKEAEKKKFEDQIELLRG